MTATLTAHFTGLLTDSTALSRRAAERHAVLSAIKESQTSVTRTRRRHRRQRATEALLRLLSIDGGLRRRSL